MPEQEDLITLLDEDGVEHDFIVLDILFVEGKEYAVLLPVEYEEAAEETEEENMDEEAVIFRIDEEDGEQVLVAVEDEKEWERVTAEWENRMDEDAEAE